MATQITRCNSTVGEIGFTMMKLAPQSRARATFSARVWPLIRITEVMTFCDRPERRSQRTKS